MNQNYFKSTGLDVDRTRQVVADMQSKRNADALRARHSLDHLRGLGSADMAMVRTHIAKHAPQGLACMCGAMAWQIEATFTIPAMVEAREGQTRLPSRLTPDVALIAGCCGERRYIDAVAVGLLPVENLPDEMMATITRRVPLEAPKPA